jgi:hypothetical protein
MGISPPGTVFPQLPPALVPQTFALFDDFLYSTGGTDPQELSAVTGFLYKNSAGVDFNHPGVLEADLSASGTTSLTYLDSATQGLVLNEYDTLSLEWQWFLTGLGAATNWSLAMGWNSQRSGCTAFPNQIGIGFTNNTVVCTNFPLPNRLTAMTGKGGVLTYTDMRASAPLFGTWVKSKIVWTKSVPKVDFFTNDVLDATVTTNLQDGFVASAKAMFGIASISTVAPGAGQFLRFDYININGTLAR